MIGAIKFFFLKVKAFQLIEFEKEKKHYNESQDTLTMCNTYIISIDVRKVYKSKFLYECVCISLVYLKW